MHQPKPAKLLTSGKRRKHRTGAQRDAHEGKGRFDLLPYWGLYRTALRYEQGANEYGDRDWEKGMPLSWFVDSMRRHAAKLAGGSTEEDHAAAIAWGALGFMHTQKMIELGKLPAELDDLPNHFKEDESRQPLASIPNSMHEANDRVWQ